MTTFNNIYILIDVYVSLSGPQPCLTSPALVAWPIVPYCPLVVAPSPGHTCLSPGSPLEPGSTPPHCLGQASSLLSSEVSAGRQWGAWSAHCGRHLRLLWPCWVSSSLDQTRLMGKWTWGLRVVALSLIAAGGPRRSCEESGSSQRRLVSQCHSTAPLLPRLLPEHRLRSPLPCRCSLQPRPHRHALPGRAARPEAQHHQAPGGEREAGEDAERGPPPRSAQGARPGG